MWSAPQRQEPIEKIRKAQWTVENTRQTQGVVDQLGKVFAALKVLGLDDTYMGRTVTRAVERFKALDPRIVV